MNDRARLMKVAGGIAWAGIGVPLMIQQVSSMSRFAIWLAAYLAFGTAFLLASARARPPLPLVVIEVAAVVGLVLAACNGFEGTLLVLVAMQLGTILRRRDAIFSIAIQTLLLGAAVAYHWNLRSAILLVPPYLGFQLLAYFVFEAIEREAEVRRALEETNAELRALQEALTEAGRVGERLRISRELHDAVGHHLTALSLHLELALQRSAGEVKETVEEAGKLTRDVLTEIRSIVASLDDARGLDLRNAIAVLASAIPRPQVHFQIADDVRVENSESARALLRCVQEIITNAARHSGAENLWIVVDRDRDNVRIRAHDDGRGTESVRDGFGLRAMRARIEEVGGELRVESHARRGFNVTALVPAEAPA